MERIRFIYVKDERRYIAYCRNADLLASGKTRTLARQNFDALVAQYGRGNPFAKHRRSIARSEGLPMPMSEIRALALPIFQDAGAFNVRIISSSDKAQIDFLCDVPRDHSLMDSIILRRALHEALKCSVEVLTEGGLNPLLRPYVTRDAQTLGGVS